MNIGGVNNSIHLGTFSKDANSKATEEKGKSIVLNNKNKNSAFEALQKTKENLIKSKNELSDKEMDPEEKKAKLNDINKQIAEIEAQIQQAKTLEKEKEQQKIKEDIEAKAAKKPQNGDEVRDGVIVSESLKKIIESRQTMDNVSNLKATKANLTVERGWLTPDDNPNSFVTRQYNKLTNGINGLEQRISAESAKVYKNATNTKTESSDEKDTDVKPREEKEEVQDKE